MILTLAAAAALLSLHWTLAALAFYSPGFATLIEGKSRILVRDGKPLLKELSRSHIPQNDLYGAIRQSGRVADVQDVALAQLETDGKISVVTQQTAVRVLEVSVAEGVQTVRLVVSGARAQEQNHYSQTTDSHCSG